MLIVGLDCGLLVFFKLLSSPAFLKYRLEEKITVCAHKIRNHNKEDDQRHFCMKWLRTLKSFQIFKIKIKKSKTYI